MTLNDEDLGLVQIEAYYLVRNVICKKGAGIIENYPYCSMSTRCIGTFKPNDKTNPYIGEKTN